MPASDSETESETRALLEQQPATVRALFRAYRRGEISRSRNLRQWYNARWRLRRAGLLRKPKRNAPRPRVLSDRDREAERSYARQWRRENMLPTLRGPRTARADGPVQDE